MEPECGTRVWNLNVILSLTVHPQQAQRPGVRYNDFLFTLSGLLSRAIWSSASLMVSLLHAIAPARCVTERGEYLPGGESLPHYLSVLTILRLILTSELPN